MKIVSSFKPWTLDSVCSVRVKTHRGRMRHIISYASMNEAIIGSDNGLSPVRHQAIICWLIVIRTLEFQWNSNQSTKIFIQQNAFVNVVRKIATNFYLSRNVLKLQLMFLLTRRSMPFMIPPAKLGFPRIQGAVSIRKTVLPGMAIPMLKIRRPINKKDGLTRYGNFHVKDKTAVRTSYL